MGLVDANIFDRKDRIQKVLQTSGFDRGIEHLGRTIRENRSSHAGGLQFTEHVGDLGKRIEREVNESRPTGTAARFHISLEYERELGLNYWERDAPKGEGVHLTFSPAKDNRLLTLAGRLKDYFIAVDLRLQSHR